MNDTTIMTLLGFLAAVIAVVTPIMRLNGSIVELKAAVDHLADKFDDLKDKVDEHDDLIHSLNTTVVNHDTRLKTLEGRKNND